MMGRNFRASHAEDSDMVRILTLTICKAHKNPEQHQVGSTPKTDKLFVIGSFKHARTRGNAVATTARVKLTRIPWYRDACKMTDCTEEYLQTVGQYYLQSPYGSVLDNRDSNVWVGGANTVSDGIRAG